MLTEAGAKEGILIYGSHFPAAGWLIIRRQGGGDAEMCSGVLISRTRFLTAAHCVCGGLSSFNSCTHDNTPSKYDLFVYFPAFGARKGKNVIVSPHYNEENLEAPLNEKYLGDLAVIEIDSPVNVKIPKLGEKFEMGAYASVGFGTFALLDSSARRIGIPPGPYKEGIAVTAFPMISKCTEVIRSDVICSNYVSTVPVWSTAAGACAGDSGGPLFLLGPGGSYVLAGITSRRSSFGGDRCITKDTVQTSFINLVLYKDWLYTSSEPENNEQSGEFSESIACKEVLIRSFSFDRHIRLGPSPIKRNITFAAASPVDELYGKINVRISVEPKDACTRVWGRPGLLSCSQDPISDFTISVSGAGFMQITSCKEN